VRGIFWKQRKESRAGRIRSSDPAPSDRAKEVALLPAGVVFLPLTILMRLIEWDGC